MSTPNRKPVRVLVVCLGNICRSPMGEAVLAHEANKLGLPVAVDSAGTANYHVGDTPDERTVSTCKKHGVPIDHQARAVERTDFKDFDYILASDNQNLSNLQRMAPKNPKAKISLFGAFGNGKPIADPYYGGQSGFEQCYKQCVSYSQGLIKEIYGEDIYDTTESTTQPTPSKTSQL
ncbi:hypothetical protein FRB94_010429 [Tulasnella sp. JGI-2019a]|nr:hypothetical protein FRB93_013859 [Tulasnella sp. JGI-2019a]KAG9010466.1 hypothetical protein FRB94_010429 [Tulasnella sp. JGI-2019a]KAG9039900.1 hypothetical protein FRB95_004372 [Tulasnella sp. JGI-2019a]